MKNQCIRQSGRSRKGMALLVVLFIVMAIAIISSGFIARADVQLKCGDNYARHRGTEYLAWAGLEHVRALVTSPDNSPLLLNWSETAIQIDPGSSSYYDLTLEDATAIADTDPVKYIYSVLSSAYQTEGGSVRARCELQGQLFYDPNSMDCYYISVSRP